LESKYFIERIEDLEQLLPLIPRELLRKDLSRLVVSVLECVSKARNIEDLNRTLLARTRVDIATLRQVADILEKLDLGGPHDLFPTRSLNPRSILTDYRSLIERFERESQTLDALDLCLRLNYGSGPLMDLMLCAAVVQADLTPVIHLVRQKLDLLDDYQVMELWSQIQREFSPERLDSMELDAEILPKNWLRTTTIPETKEKIANYVVTLKPRLELVMFKSGRHVIPHDAPSLALLLSLTDSAAAVPVLQFELDLASALARLRSYWENILIQPRLNFNRALGLSGGESFLDSKEYQGVASKVTRADHNAERLIIYELKKIIRAIDSLLTYESPVEKALTQYKLGTEVMAPDNIKDLSQKNELRLQKELCRFLLERGIFTVGTKFGRSETDLLANLPDEGYIIEAKVYKYTARVSEKTIKNNLVQLQSYMDQNPTRTRGILVIYNFSSTFISAPRQWIDGRFWFLPINLQKEPPSGRNRSLVIERGDGDDVIRVLNVQPPAKH